MRAARHAGGVGVPASGGFTLLEVIVALALAAVLAVVLMAGRARTGAEVAAEAAILKGHLRFSQAMAMANNTVVWSVSVGDRAYTLQRDGLPSPMGLPDEDSSTHQLADGVTISQGGGVITFTEWGDPVESRTIVLSDGTSTHTVTVLSGTGFIP
jgi:prepilin-type N-terminal cleavage/methylation domain-containing protein